MLYVICGGAVYLEREQVYQGGWGGSLQWRHPFGSRKSFKELPFYQFVFGSPFYPCPQQYLHIFFFFVRLKYKHSSHATSGGKSPEGPRGQGQAARLTPWAPMFRRLGCCSHWPVYENTVCPRAGCTCPRCYAEQVPM